MMTLRNKGFTLIELLVVVLILAILMAIALPLYLRAVSDSERQTCRANMQTIASAEQAHKLRSADHTYTTDLSVGAAGDLTTLCGPDKDLQALPVCPKSADPAVVSYTVVINDGSDAAKPAGSITVACAVADTGHGEFTPGIDSK